MLSETKFMRNVGVYIPKELLLVYGHLASQDLNKWNHVVRKSCNGIADDHASIYAGNAIF